MAGYVNPDGQARLVTKVFGNANGKTVRAKSLWVNRDGAPACIYREGERNLYVVGLDAGVGNKIFPMAYSYDFETFRACSITMPSTHTSYKPTAILNVIYSEELSLFVALGYYLQKNYTSSSPLYWYLMYSEDGKNWEVSHADSYTYYSTNIQLVYEPTEHLFLVANGGPKPSGSGFYFYSSTDGKTWTKTPTITPTNVSNAKLYTAYNINSLLVPGDGYIYLSGTGNSTFYDGSSYYPFLRTKDGVNYEVYRVGVDFNSANLMYGSRSLIYCDGKYYSLDSGMYLHNEDMTSQQIDYYNVGIHISSDDMQTWSFIPLDVSSINKDWDGSKYDGFFILGDKLFCSIAKDSTEVYLYSSESGASWVKEEDASDVTVGSLSFSVSDDNLFRTTEKLYTTHNYKINSTQDGIVYTYEAALEASMYAPFSLSSSSNHVIAAKMAGTGKEGS